MSTTRHSFTHEHHDLEDEHEKMLERWTENQSSNHNDIKKIEKTNFFTPKCHECKSDMKFLEGDVIYGDRWYHVGCWKEPEKIKLLTQ